MSPHSRVKRRSLPNDFRPLTFSSLFFIATLWVIGPLTGCGSSSSYEREDSLSGGLSGEDLTPFSSDVIYAKNWSEVVIQANFAKTTLTVGAHLITTRNACGRDAYGAIPLQIWNTLAQQLNQAILTPWGEEYCTPEVLETDSRGYTKKHVDGGVEIQLEGGQRKVLFQAKEGSLCTSISDHALSEKLLASLNQIVIQADSEECPNGWGSN